MKTSGTKKKPHGTIRRGQLLSIGGPGAMLDLPEHSIIVGGLDGWQGADSHPVYEPRLAAKVQQALGAGPVKLYAPPGWDDSPTAPHTGVTAYRFPRWFVAQGRECEVAMADGTRSRPLVHQWEVSGGQFTYNRKQCKVVPVRFVQACPNGHIDDVDWKTFVHGGRGDCAQRLWLDERGTSGDLTDLTVRCGCGVRRSLAQATRPGTLGACLGARPWLGSGAGEKCVGPNGKPEMTRLLIRSASNAYFAQQLSVISIPEQGQRVRDAVAPVWDDFLQYLESADELSRERRKDKVKHALEGLSDADVWREMERRRAGATPVLRPIKLEELDTLMACDDSAGGDGAVGEDTPHGDFYARAVRLAAGRSALMRRVARVVQVHRLREVVAQVGFTRFESSMPDVDGELALDVRRAPLAHDVTWVPAVEHRGEGVFIVPDPGKLAEWEARPAVQARAERLRAGFAGWKAQHPQSSFEWPGVRYVFLHSLSHLLLTAVALECGYQASAIRERVYVGASGCGILLHTGSSDAEGTLGGLAQMGAMPDFERHLRKALELARLCSNDPVCAQHEPDDTRAERYLLGAACHGCLLIGETSCERRNELLDRALVVSTVEALGAEFFPDGEFSGW